MGLSKGCLGDGAAVSLSFVNEGGALEDTGDEGLLVREESELSRFTAIEAATSVGAGSTVTLGGVVASSAEADRS